MTDQHESRDHLLAGLLAELPVAEHADGFWSEFDGHLADEPRPPLDIATQVAPSSNGAGPAPGSTDPVPAAAEIYRFDSGAPATRNRRWPTVIGLGLVAAVAVVAALFGLRALSAGDSDGESNIITNEPADGRPTVNDGRLDGPAGDQDDGETGGDVGRGTVDYANPSPPRSIGPGSVIGFSPDGARLLVLDDHPGGESGSEAAPLLTVWAHPVEGGEPRLALPEELTVETGTSGRSFVIGPGGDIAWVEWCDGVLCGLRSAVLLPTGEITDVIDLEWRGLGAEIGGGPVEVTDLVFGGDGSLYLAVSGRLMVASRGFSWIDIAETALADAVVVVDRPDGDEVLTWSDGVLEGPDGPITDRIDLMATDLVASPAGLVAAYGRGGLAIVDPADGSLELSDEGSPLLSQAETIEIAFSPDGRATAAIIDGDLLLEDSEGDDFADAGRIGTVRGGVFAPDGTAYAFTTIADDGVATATIVDFPIVADDAEAPSG